jgi:NTE family protein
MEQLTGKRALVLSGGGGRGAYHVGALRFLEEHDWLPDVIVGTSIGAVNGAAIASGHDSRSLRALWGRLTTDQVQRRDWHLLDLFSLMKRDHLLDTAPLRETLVREGWIDLERVNAAPPEKHLRITAVESSTGRLRVFGNSPDVIPGGRSEHVRISLDHILASCSIPVIYPPTRIENATLWDGGTVANTPLGPAIDAGAEDIVVVLMTPWDEAHSRPRYLDVGNVEELITAAQVAFEWALLASFQTDLRLFKRTNLLAWLQEENARLQAQNAQLRAELEQVQASLPAAPPVEQKQPYEQVAPQPPAPLEEVERQFRQVPSPVIVSPQAAIPAVDIIRYDLENHERLYRMGYEDARLAWQGAGRPVEGAA